MELFPDGEHVRLRRREDGTYLHADEDGWGVSLNPHRASLNTAWAVHLVPRAHLGTTDVLLHSAAYGRYLGARPDYAPPQAHPVGFFRMVQCLYNTPMQADIMWEVTEDGNGGVFLRHLVGNQNHLNNLPWTVEPILPRLAPPAIPDQIPNGVVAPMVLTAEPDDTVHPGRQLRYLYLAQPGIAPVRWPVLIGDLANQLNDNYNNITLCVRASSLGRVTPLVVDLPLSEKTMDIVVLTTGSAAAMALRRPNVDAP